MFFMMWIYMGTNTSEPENVPCRWSSYPSSTSPSSTVTSIPTLAVYVNEEEEARFVRFVPVPCGRPSLSHL